MGKDLGIRRGAPPAPPCQRSSPLRIFHSCTHTARLMQVASNFLVRGIGIWQNGWKGHFGCLSRSQPFYTTGLDLILAGYHPFLPKIGVRAFSLRFCGARTDCLTSCRGSLQDLVVVGFSALLRLLIGIGRYSRRQALPNAHERT